MDHRGRFQAQGKNLQESEPWDQNEPLSIQKGLILHRALKNKLRPKDLRLRCQAFDDCEEFIKKAAENGGIDVTHYPNKASWSWTVYGAERVDLEIFRGIAFVEKDDN